MAAATEGSAPAETQRTATATQAGYVDAIVSGRIYGWAYDQADTNAALSVDVYHEGRLIGTAEANRFREDLKNLGIGDGRHAFVFDLPSELRYVGDAELRIFFAGTDTELQRNDTLAPAKTSTSTSVAVRADDAGDGESSTAASPAIDLSPRSRHLEDTLGKVLNLVVAIHGQDVEQRKLIEAQSSLTGLAKMDKKLEASFQAMNRRLDDQGKSVSTIETFLVRFDAQLKTMAEKGSSAELQRSVRKRARGTRLTILLATALIVAVELWRDDLAAYAAQLAARIGGMF